MSTGILIAIVVVVVIGVLVCAMLARMIVRRRRLKEKFGPEYERALDSQDSRMAAERELREREERHDSLEIKPLPSGVRDEYADGWSRAQERFVDRPDDAVHEADRLVTALMGERGYPTSGFEQQLKDLSVEHGRTLEHYRAAHEVNDRSSKHEATTEELRGAMVHYRALFEELLHNGHQPGKH
ncbi:hypothetical protein [Streptomyces sp. G7(2002)]|uniref:hypothetical protein n=1 Tax=Streptomyces sp. G7(2002) TaxID=2971798 RepID=UPI00237E358B|nr:hypothetical protein [Streptomyces sp. G7(2002)]WDT58499.1 hypothetical protein NUT86_33205 [Streptomyces sp. G7(2002)]